MNKYIINNTVGKIGQTGIFLGSEKSSGKPIAIKLFSGVTESQKENLLRDAKILQSFSHPNIVKILDSGVDEENNVFYVMEYLKGTPLNQEIHPSQGLTFQQSWPLIQQISSALSAIHEHGILHLDLKPGNILMVQGQPKLIDFGVLQPLETGTFRGTPGYVAPEVILGNRPSIQSDIYSFGALLTFIWTGHKLYEGDSPENTLAHQLKNLDHKLENPELAKVISRATQADPHKRYSSLNDMLKALSLYQHEQAYLAQEPDEDPTQTQCGRWIIAAALTSLVCIAIAIYYSLLNSV